MKQSQQVTQGQAIVIEALNAGHCTIPAIGAHLKIHNNSAYQLLYTLRKIGMVESMGEGKYRLLSDDFTVKDMTEDPNCPNVTNLQIRVLKEIIDGATTTKEISNLNGMSRPAITHVLTHLYRKKLLNRKNNPLGPVRSFGYVYTYTGLPYKESNRTGGRALESEKNISYEACDLLIWRAA